MFRSHQFIATCFAIGALALVPAVSAAANAEEETSSKIVDLAPFTHVAYIPLDADLSSIKFKAIKAVRVATKQRSATSLRYCEERVDAEPGGSMYCPLATDESPASAYRVTYTFTGQPMASDEYGGTSFTFSVYFRPDEISQRLRQALSSSEISRTDLSEYFQLTASRDSVQQLMIDEANSTVCDGNYVDGNWSRINPKCQDSIAHKEVARAAPYIMVRVDPAYRLQANVATTGLRWK